MHFDFTVNLAAVLQLPVLFVAWRVLRFLNRFVNIQRDYPPHLHAGSDRILYPSDYPPPTNRSMGAAAGSGQ